MFSLLLLKTNIIIYLFLKIILKLIAYQNGIENCNYQYFYIIKDINIIYLFFKTILKMIM